MGIVTAMKDWNLISTLPPTIGEGWVIFQDMMHIGTHDRSCAMRDVIRRLWIHLLDHCWSRTIAGPFVQVYHQAREDPCDDKPLPLQRPLLIKERD
jgi:hypothetical protein